MENIFKSNIFIMLFIFLWIFGLHSYVQSRTLSVPYSGKEKIEISIKLEGMKEVLTHTINICQGFSWFSISSLKSKKDIADKRSNTLKIGKNVFLGYEFSNIFSINDEENMGKLKYYVMQDEKDFDDFLIIHANHLGFGLYYPSEDFSILHQLKKIT